MKELTPNEWHKLLNRYVADAEAMRPVMMKPFEQDGYVCASDTHIQTTIPPTKQHPMCRESCLNTIHNLQ